MLLTPAERDRLLIFTAAELARVRRARGLRLNVPETVALVADTVCEVARDGGRHADALAAGRAVLGPDDVLPGVADVVSEVKVEAVFDDGTRLVVVPHPVAPRHDPPAAPGSTTTIRDHALPEHGPVAVESHAGIPTPDRPDHRDRPDTRDGVDGVDGGNGPDGTTRVSVVNTADVPISVSSHFHFFEANPRLRFDRAAAYGRHLRVPAGSTVRFDPGAEVTVRLVPFGGNRVIIGFSGLVDGPLDAPGARDAALQRARACGYLGA